MDYNILLTKPRCCISNIFNSFTCRYNNNIPRLGESQFSSQIIAEK